MSQMHQHRLVHLDQSLFGVVLEEKLLRAPFCYRLKIVPNMPVRYGSYGLEEPQVGKITSRGYIILKLIRDVDDALLNRRRYGFCSICSLKLFQNTVDMISRSVPADLKHCPDLFVCQTLGQHLKNF